MPLEELGLLLVPPLSKVEIETRYGALIEQGKAKAKGKLVNLIWETVKKSPTMQIYLSKVMLGWNEKAGVGEPKTPEPLESETGNSPPANSNMPSRLDLNRIFPAAGRK